MKNYNTTLWGLVAELFDTNEKNRLRALATAEIPDTEALIAHDKSLCGPSMTRLMHNHTERYAMEDRAIFQSLHYCALDFIRINGADWENDAKWFTRDLMEKSDSHIQALLKKIGAFSLPTGAALRNTIVKSKVDSTTWKQIDTFTHVCREAKHNFSRNKDAPLFSVEDALLSYFICRKLGMKLYPLANLATDMTIFEKDCE